MAKRILVIGGAGYIGSHVQKQLLIDGFDVLIYDNLSTGSKINILVDEKNVFINDILDTNALNYACSQNIDGIIYLAAKKAVGESMIKPENYALNNITGAMNILQAMVKNNIKHIVFSSSAAVYGMPQYIPLDENHPINPINYYGYTKLCMEQNMEWFFKLGKLNYCALRYFNAVGYDKDGDITAREIGSQNLMPIIMEVATGKRDKLQVYGNDYDTIDGTCVRDYVHVSDLAVAHSLALTKLIEDDKQSYTFNLGTGTGTSVQEIINATEKVMGKKLNYEFAPRRSGDPAFLTAKAELAFEVLGWKPKYTNIEDIIQTVWNLEIK